jgi:hypothetical protein
MEMTKIENIWVGLESDTSNHSGLLYKRYSAEVLPDVFVALKAPEKLRCIAFRISSHLMKTNGINSKTSRLKRYQMKEINRRNFY